MRCGVTRSKMPLPTVPGRVEPDAGDRVHVVQGAGRGDGTARDEISADREPAAPDAEPSGTAGRASGRGETGHHARARHQPCPALAFPDHTVVDRRRRHPRRRGWRAARIASLNVRSARSRRASFSISPMASSTPWVPAATAGSSCRSRGAAAATITALCGITEALEALPWRRSSARNRAAEPRPTRPLAWSERPFRRALAAPPAMCSAARRRVRPRSAGLSHRTRPAAADPRSWETVVSRLSAWASRLAVAAARAVRLWVTLVSHQARKAVRSACLFRKVQSLDFDHADRVPAPRPPTRAPHARHPEEVPP